MNICPYCDSEMELKEDNTEDYYYVFWCETCQRYVTLSYQPGGEE